MTNDRAKAARRQRSTGAEVRVHVVKVRLSPAELQKLTERAGDLGVTVPRLLVESALAGGVQTLTESRGLLAEFFGARRLIGAIGHNINQLARVANATGQMPPELPSALRAVERVLSRLQAAVDGLGER